MVPISDLEKLLGHEISEKNENIPITKEDVDILEKDAKKSISLLKTIVIFKEHFKEIEDFALHNLYKPSKLRDKLCSYGLGTFDNDEFIRVYKNDVAHDFGFTKDGEFYPLVSVDYENKIVKLNEGLSNRHVNTLIRNINAVWMDFTTPRYGCDAKLVGMNHPSNSDIFKNFGDGIAKWNKLIGKSPVCKDAPSGLKNVTLGFNEISCNIESVDRRKDKDFRGPKFAAETEEDKILKIIDIFDKLYSSLQIFEKLPIEKGFSKKRKREFIKVNFDGLNKFLLIGGLDDDLTIEFFDRDSSFSTDFPVPTYRVLYRNAAEWPEDMVDLHLKFISDAINDVAKSGIDYVDPLSDTEYKAEFVKEDNK